MQIIKQEFEDRVAEINRYFHLLESIIEKEAQLIFPNENDRREVFNIDLQGTLKSSAILLLYNLVESSISKCLELIHSAITDEQLIYDEISDNIQKIWLAQFYDKFKETSNNETGLLNNLKLMVDTLIKNNVPVELNYKDKEKRSGEISGNLDSRKIRDISKKYGIAFNESTDKLKEIKEKRIELAHGIKSFLECCNNTTFTELFKSKEETVTFLRAFISAVEIYLSNKVYKKLPQDTL
jgi:hypothetical protein